MTSNKKRLTLSFDNGPDPVVTPQVLKELAFRDLKSTFFVLGKNMAEPGLRKLAVQAHAEGHWIGNHTYTHEVPLGEDLDQEAPQREIGATEALVADLVHPDKLFRPFGGGGNLDCRLLSPEAHRYLEANGYTCVLWNSIPRDWEDPEGWVERALEQLDTFDWTVMVLHDLATGAMDQFGGFLDTVAARGIEVVQEFPENCLPMWRGHSNPLMDKILATPPG